MSTVIKVYAAVVVSENGSLSGVGSLAAPVTTITGVQQGTTFSGNVSCAPGVSTELFNTDNDGRFTFQWIRPSVDGIVSEKADDDAGSMPTWKHTVVKAGRPYFIPTDEAISQVDPAIQAGDSAGVPTGLAAAVACRIRSVLFTPAASVVSASKCELGLFP